MTHIAIFALILSLPLGMAAVFLVWNAYKKHGQRYFYTFAAMLLVLNATVVLNLVNINYITLFLIEIVVLWTIIYRPANGKRLCLPYLSKNRRQKPRAVD